MLGASDGAVPDTRRAYLMGFAAFEKGDAEQAAASFGEARQRFHALEFPYHGDPVLYVQSSFYLAEATLARGEREEAKRHYEEFLGMWGGTRWKLQAVDRAREKLATLSESPIGG